VITANQTDQTDQTQATKRGRALEGEEGSTLLLTIFYGFLSLVLVFLVVAATSLYL
jgi:hypothetical protein